MAYPKNPIYKFYNSPLTGNLDGVRKQTGEITLCIPINEEKKTVYFDSLRACCNRKITYAGRFLKASSANPGKEGTGSGRGSLHAP